MPTTYPTAVVSVNSAPPVSQATCNTATISVSPNIATASVLILAANANRKGLLIYNNSANSIYLAYGAAASSSTSMTRVLTTFTQFAMEAPIYTGAIYGIRNAGSGTCLITELT